MIWDERFQICPVVIHININIFFFLMCAFLMINGLENHDPRKNELNEILILFSIGIYNIGVSIV